MTAEFSLIPYVDTSALAKRYLDEAFSDEFDEYLGIFSWAAISSLTLVEMHCLLARRRRYNELTPDQELNVRQALREDIDLGHLRVLPVNDNHHRAALLLLDELEEHSLRTLDALHLGILRAAGHHVLATADRTMSTAAEALDLQVQRFFD